MKKAPIMVAVLLLGGVATGLSLFACRGSEEPRQVSQEESFQVALRFVANSPTFRFDGMPGSIELRDTETLRCPSCYAFTFQFQTAHSGHGDRKGLVVLPVITDHQVRVVVQERRVTQAVCDGVWDMLSQRYLGP